MRTVFLDHQSSTPVLPEIFEEMKPFFLERFGNPSSLHQQGARAREALARARSQCVALLQAESPDDIIFTSGGTEAINLAVKGVALANQRYGNHIVLSAIEHPAVRNSVEFLEKLGFTATRVPVDHYGWVDPEAVRAALKEETILVCVQHANHDVGTIQAIQKIAEVLSERGIALFVDALASAGWLPINVQEMGISLLALAPHRFYGPKGVGVLYRNRRTRLTSWIHGGDQEQGRRPGTENVPAIVGAGMAAELAVRDQQVRHAHTAKLQRRLWEKLLASVPYLALNGPPPGTMRSTTNLNVSAEFTEGEGQLLSLDLAGIAVASGASCVSKSLEVSPVLEAMGVSRALALASIILSLGKDNTEEEMDYFVTMYAKVVQKLREMSPLWDEFQAGLTDSAVQPRSQGFRAGAKPPPPAVNTHS